MMEKAIKQRLLGGLVLVAGAALFLPVLLDGSGAALTIPPMPPAPEVAGVEGMAPRLDQKVAEAGAEVAAAHEGRNVVPAPESGGEVAPDAAALAAADGSPAGAGAAAAAATPAVAATAPAKPAPVESVTKPATAPATARPATAPPAPRPAPESTPAVARAEVRPAISAAPKPEPKPEPKPVESRVDKPAAGAWMVQVARVSSREKAQDLLRKLRAKGYAAVLSQQGDSWKVMVGPELSREVAVSTKNRLNADAAIGVSDAWVQAYKP